MSDVESAPKMCLRCARRALAKLPAKPCGACPLLNVDRLAQVRANAARPSPLQRFTFASAEANAAQVEPLAYGEQHRLTSWERGE
ncbi:MAG: hypothetical protein KGZ65_04095 [Sphingomonadales bacterium]|nr:hypothetical protein [Sphingomonadaceae bacterium]MBS3930394.1 hypothetical protein [Sphingomonadales bacterium]